MIPMKDFMDIFLTFCKVGSVTFGGGYAILPILQNYVVIKKQWVTDEEIIDYYAIAQSLPGAIAVNVSMLIGYKYKGRIGLIISALGVITPSVIVILIIAMFLQNFMNYEIVRYAFNGIAVAILALIINTAKNMFKVGVKDKLGIVIFLITLLIIFIFDVSPIVPLVISGLVGLTFKIRKG